MAVYEYRAVSGDASCEHCREVFELQQSMKDEALQACPQCGSPVQRLISLCQVSTTQSSKSMLSDKNLKAKGFTKLVNEGGGKFRKI
jgi:putative FmdB family regulatory protein